MGRSKGRGTYLVLRKYTKVEGRGTYLLLKHGFLFAIFKILKIWIPRSDLSKNHRFW